MDYGKIKPYIENNLIGEQPHPKYPDIRIFNYTKKCQFGQAWDDITVQCRGLIMNVKTGEIIAKPFRKFFNYEEHINKGLFIPEEKPVVYEKLDGSLGILYQVDRVPYIATRGSFTSDQAIWATKWWREKVGMLPTEGETNLFEIIYPENRIVVNYDFSGLVYLATLDLEGKTIFRDWDFVKSAKKLEINDLEKIKSLSKENEEGFVFFYPEANTRIKFKFPEYVRLHRLVAGFSEKFIWELLKEHQSFDDLIEKVPDEFYNWVKETKKNLIAQYEKIEAEVLKNFSELQNKLNGKTRKEWAIEIQKYPNQKILFTILDKKDYEEMIWRIIKPKSQTYKTDIDL